MGTMNRADFHASRRGFLWSLASGLAAAFTSAAFPRLCAAAEHEPVTRLAWSRAVAPQLTLETRYRADAQILLLGVPVLRREGVGGGSVSWREFTGDGGSRLLEFNGFSIPERAAGLSRLGFIREVARTSPGSTESLYFGLMTASPEESAEEARKALHSATKEQAYTAIEGRILPGKMETAIAHFSVPSAISPERRAELVENARRALDSAETISAATPTGGQTFLQVLAEMLARPDGADGRYIYSGRPYRLRLTRAADAKATAHFRELRMIPGASEVIRVSGRLRREAGGKETAFTVWIPGGAQRPMPLRIEYQAKPYLRLIFEAVNP